tara:strand:+ start:2526 stop:3005 length:480 start_codon:yes stop_codon:yes gene_type:complete
MVTYREIKHHPYLNTNKQINKAMSLKTDCYKCIHRRTVPGSCHSSCAMPDKEMTGDEHGITQGWFYYPVNFDPVWCTKECVNYKGKTLKFEVWSEGYRATGERGTAQFLGTYEAETFKEACKIALKDKGWDLDSYDEINNTYWACRFFDSEDKARKSFG